MDTFAFLLGTWNVTRSIEDTHAGTRGTFHGTATLLAVSSADGTPVGVRAQYEEHGELQFGAHIGSARRSLAYVRLDDATVMRCFADGRPFLPLDLANGAWRGTHLCGDDRYDIATLARSPDVVQEHWRVTGPSTGYNALATLTRTR